VASSCLIRNRMSGTPKFDGFVCSNRILIGSSVSNVTAFVSPGLAL
jgi:hypothetical protein